MHAWLLVGGRVTFTNEVRRRRAHPPGLVVAADGGIQHADLLGVRPDLWVGDFDSSEAHEHLHVGVPRETHPPAKDQTDAELALAAAVRLGATSVTVWGAFGGRFDHTLALALLAVRETARGLPVELHGGDETGVPLLPGRPLDLPARPGQVLSVLALDDLRVLRVSGVRWPLSGVDVPSGSGWTVSNEVQHDHVALSVSAGRALVMQFWD